MDLQNLIGALGFPIVICLLMAYYIKYLTDKNRETMEKMSMQHKDEMLEVKNDVTKAINNNTQVMMKLTELIINEKGGNE